MDTSVFDEEQIALLNDVSEFYLDRALPIDEKNKIIGFGKVHDFYQSYISVKNGELLFTVRSAPAPERPALGITSTEPFAPSRYSTVKGISVPEKFSCQSARSNVLDPKRSGLALLHASPEANESSAAKRMRDRKRCLSIMVVLYFAAAK